MQAAPGAIVAYCVVGAIALEWSKPGRVRGMLHEVVDNPWHLIGLVIVLLGWPIVLLVEYSER
jgi:hypothetical protein